MPNLDLTIAKIMKGDIEALKIMQGDTEVWTCIYSVTTNLTNITSDAPSYVNWNGSLTVNLTANTGHYIDDSSVVVMMGETDITSTAYSNGVVSVAEVTGDVSITATTMFDAQVEYLQGDGVAYIDTGINLRQVLTITMNLSISKTITTNSATIGAYFDNSTYPKLQLYINNYCQWGWGNKYATYFDYTGITKGGDVAVNTLYTPVITTKSSQNSDATIYVFARNNENNKLPIDGLRIYSIEMAVSNNLVRDYISVRKNGVGYLFDKVNKVLYGNAAGSGAFTYGNDV